MTGSSNETIGYCDFEIDNLTVFTGVAEDNPSLGVVLDEDELLQKKEGEAIMSHVKELVTTIDDKKELICLMDKEKTGGQNFGTTTMLENQNFILIEDEDTVLEELKLIARINQEEGRQLLEIVKEEEKEYVETSLQHIDEMLENRWLNCFPKAFREENEMVEHQIEVLH